MTRFLRSIRLDFIALWPAAAAWRMFWLLLLAGATGASAQTPASPPVESVVVNGASSSAVNGFVQSIAALTHVTGKVARWEDPICPYALGLPDDLNAIVVQRVKALARDVGARVSGGPACKPNIIIAFTSTPQALLDSIRADHSDFLGYHVGPADLEKIAIVRRPIQAWYSTVTIDQQGHRESDSSRTDSGGRGLMVNGSCAILGSQRVPTPTSMGVMNLPNPLATCTMVLPTATKAIVKGSRLTDDLRSGFDHVTIVADPTAAGESRETVDDYIAMLALAQVSDPGACQPLPSIANLLAANCRQDAKALTANDVSYLKGLYQADPAKLGNLQMNEIAHRMEQEGAAAR